MKMKTITLEDGTKVEISEESYKAFQTAVKKTSFEKWQETTEEQQCVCIDLHSNIVELGLGRGADEKSINIVKTETQAKSILAYAQLIWLRDDVRGDWLSKDGICDWVIINNGRLTLGNYIYTVSFLSFQTGKIASQFLSDHKELIQQYFDGLK